MDKAKIEALQELRQAVERCVAAGIDVRVSPFYYCGGMNTALILEGVEIRNGRLIIKPASGGQHDERG